MKVSILATAALVLAGSVTAVHSQALATLNSGGNILNMQSTSGRSVPGLQFIGGYGNLDFSQGSEIASFLELGNPEFIDGAVSAFAVMGASLSGTSGATVVEQIQTDALGDTQRYSAAWNNPAASSVTLLASGSSGGQIQTLSLGGGLSMVSARRSGIATGGSVQMNNIRVNLGTGQIIADLTGTRFAIGGLTTKPAVDFSRPNTVMWTAGSLAGPTRISPEALLATNPVNALEATGLTVVEPRVVTTYQPGGTCIGYNGYQYLYSCPIEVRSEGFTAVRADIQLNDLALSDEGAAFLADSLGLQATSFAAMTNVNAKEGLGKWGSLKVGAFFRAEDAAGVFPGIPASIPEPSTYALMGLGLLGVWGVSRRAARHQPSA